MNNKLITIGLICETAIFTPLGIVLPELLFGIGSILMGGTLLGFRCTY